MTHKQSSSVPISMGIYQTLFDSASEGLVLVDAQGTIILVNPRLEAMFGYEPEELLGQKIEVLIPKAIGERHQQYRKDFMKAPKQRSMGKGMELSASRKDDSTFPVEVSLNYLQDGEHRLAMGLVTDISERRRAEEALQKTESCLRALHRITSDQELDMSERIQQLLQLGCEYFQCEVGALSQHEDDAPELMALYSTKGEKPDLLDCDRVRAFCAYTAKQDDAVFVPDATQTDWLNIDCCTHGPYDTFFGIRILINDKTFGNLCFMATQLAFEPSTTDREMLKLMAEWVGGELFRKSTQERLQALNDELEEKVRERTEKIRESEKLYRAIARNFPDGTINVFDRKLNYVFVEGKELFKLGVTSEMLIGSNYVDRLPKEIASSVVEHLQKVFDGQVQSMEFDLRENHYVLDAVPLVSGQHTIDQILVVEKNITKQKQAEEELAKSLQKERELNELKSRFVSMASHEFRTPLSTILSSVSLIGKYTSTEQQDKRSKHINRIKTSVNTLTNILNDFLSLDKLEAGKVECHPSYIDLKLVIEGAMEEMQTVVKTGQKIAYQHTGPNDPVFLDQQLVRNILFNLVSNAIKYSPEHSSIRVSSERTDKQVIITVRDEGMGIPKAEQKHLFERFFRAKNATNIQGTGLGLNIVKKYVELMEGTIRCESAENQGSTFIIEFPQNPST